MNIRRYDIGREHLHSIGMPAITEQENGAYVRHDDHEALVQEMRAEIAALERTVMDQTVVIVELREAKCDGNHGGPRCADPGCWNDSSQPAEPVREPSDERILVAFIAHTKRLYTGNPKDHKDWSSFKAGFEAAQQDADKVDARPDMFWDNNDPERCQDCIHNVLVEVQCNRDLSVGDVIEVQQAVRLANISVRITAAEDDEGNGDMEYEVIDSATQHERQP